MILFIINVIFVKKRGTYQQEKPLKKDFVSGVSFKCYKTLSSLQKYGFRAIIDPGT
jgi:hypothetical protein